MLISRKYEFTLIHPPKTAGTSIKHALAPYADVFPLDLVEGTRVENFVRQAYVLPQHFSMAQAQNLLQLDFGHYLRVAAVRNPWTRYASLYYFFRRIGTHPTSVFCHIHTFTQFIELVVLDVFPTDCRNQAHFLVDRDKQMRYDYFIRSERIKQDLHALADRLGLEVQLPYIRANPAADEYATLYTERSRKLVAAYCAQEVELLGYEFPY